MQTKLGAIALPWIARDRPPTLASAADGLTLGLGETLSALASRITLDALLSLLPTINGRWLGLVGRWQAGGGAQGKCGDSDHPDHAPTTKTRHADTTTTATSEVGRKIFQPNRINWS